MRIFQIVSGTFLVVQEELASCNAAPLSSGTTAPWKSMKLFLLPPPLTWKRSRQAGRDGSSHIAISSNEIHLDGRNRKTKKKKYILLLWCYVVIAKRGVLVVSFQDLKMQDVNSPLLRCLLMAYPRLSHQPQKLGIGCCFILNGSNSVILAGFPPPCLVRLCTGSDSSLCFPLIRAF